MWMLQLQTGAKTIGKGLSKKIKFWAYYMEQCYGLYKIYKSEIIIFLETRLLWAVSFDFKGTVVEILKYRSDK